MTDRDTPEPTEAELALTRLVDGTLSEGTAEQLRARAEASPELRARLAEQERAVSLVRSVDVAAPDALHARIAGMLDQTDATTAGDRTAADQSARRHGRRRRSGFGRWSRDSRWRNTLFLPAATALAIVIVALVFLLGGGASSPSIDQTARLGLSPATAPAPPRDATHPAVLAAAVDGIPFPYYGATTGWQASGRRSDLVHERKIVTIFYRAQDGTRVGYSIVPGSALSNPGGPNTVRGGVRYWFGREGSGRYVTWLRDGHTCVIAGKTVSNRVLLRLAIADEHTAV